MLEFKFKIILLICLVLSQTVLAQKLKENSIGVVYLLSDNVDYYEFEIAFPIQFLEENQKYIQQEKIKPNQTELNFSNEIKFFDENGVLFKTKTKEKGKLEFWCENDGGIQYRPTIILRIDKKSISKKLKPIKDIQNICCFALTNHKQENPSNKSISKKKNEKDVRLKGKINERNWAEIWVRPDDSHNCDGQPENNLMIFLNVYGQDYRLRCCGP